MVGVVYFAQANDGSDFSWYTCNSVVCLAVPGAQIPISSFYDVPGVDLAMQAQVDWTLRLDEETACSGHRQEAVAQDICDGI